MCEIFPQTAQINHKRRRRHQGQVQSGTHNMVRSGDGHGREGKEGEFLTELSRQPEPLCWLCEPESWGNARWRLIAVARRRPLPELGGGLMYGAREREPERFAPPGARKPLFRHYWRFQGSPLPMAACGIFWEDYARNACPALKFAGRPA